MKLRALSVVGLFVAVAVPMGLPAGRALASIIVNFDTFPDGSIVPRNAVITTQYAPVGVLFASPAPAGGPLALSNGEQASAPNFLVGLAPGQGGQHPITMDFISALAATVDVTLVSVGTGTTTATAYASDMTTILASVSVTRGPLAGNGFGNHDPITLAGPLSGPLAGLGIARVIFSIAQNGPVLDGYGIDDVEFTIVPAPGPAAVLTAFGLLWSRRRR